MSSTNFQRNAQLIATWNSSNHKTNYTTLCLTLSKQRLPAMDAYMSFMPSKINSEPPVANFENVKQCFEHVHLDIVGSLSCLLRYIYCLTYVERFTSWPEVMSLETITAKTVLRPIYNSWISRFGIPLKITTDQRRQFECHLFKELIELTGSTHLRTTPDKVMTLQPTEWWRVFIGNLKMQLNDMKAKGGQNFYLKFGQHIKKI